MFCICASYIASFISLFDCIYACALAKYFYAPLNPPERFIR
nr:MAG TPA: hypothetical protein [Caudoviricetes sp.]